MKTTSIGFIGGGRITRIFLTAFKNASLTFSRVTVYDPQETVLQDLETRFPGIITTSADLKAAGEANMVFLAIHPPAIPETLARIRECLKEDAIVISLAPKFTIDKMSELLGGFGNLVRINPSASTIINKGLNPVFFSPSISGADKEKVGALMAHLGLMPEVAEAKIEAYAMISAMGHTYFWPQIQRLKELAVSFGMNDREAISVIKEMLTGTSETLFDSGLTYTEVTDLVPVKPLAEVESAITGFYDQYLTALFKRITP
jgi:pyrroline-5-carboxylate reductase